jgi:hypothetical protein
MLVVHVCLACAALKTVLSARAASASPQPPLSPQLPPQQQQPQQQQAAPSSPLLAPGSPGGSSLLSPAALRPSERRPRHVEFTVGCRCVAAGLVVRSSTLTIDLAGFRNLFKTDWLKKTFPVVVLYNVAKGTLVSQTEAHS